MRERGYHGEEKNQKSFFYDMYPVFIDEDDCIFLVLENKL